MYKHILIATDGSELASRAVDQGLRFASSIGAATTIVTVTEPWPSFAMANEAEFASLNQIEAYEKSAETSARRILDAAAQSAKSLGVPAKIINPKNVSPAAGIIEVAETKGCDLIVMASHGRRGIRRLVLGSQTAEVLAHTSIPALVLRFPEEAETVPPMPLS